MKLYVLTIVLLICSLQMFYCQEGDGVVSLALPVRNSLTFNRYLINPTFSFVREQNKYINITNKRQWVQFEDAPTTYFANYSGRLKENIGAGIGLFQQDYGVLTTFGGILNFAYNAQIQRDNNLTFGLNLGVYSSGINTGRTVTNFSDPSLENVPSNLLVTVNPAINYGLAQLDFGVSLNNAVLYNVNTSELIQDNPEQSLQGHIMYTGYMSGSGFFDETKFSALVRSEFRTENTIISGMAMLTVPKGIWAQAGYNTLYGASAGVGLNITENIAAEYNYEQAFGDFTDFGSSHEITLAYRFVSRERYDYSSGDEVTGIFTKRNKRVKKPTKKIDKAQAEANRLAAQERRAQAKLDAQAKAIAQEEAKVLAEENKIAELEAQKQAEIKAQQSEEATTNKAEEEANKLAETQAKEKEVANALAQARAEEAQAEALAKEQERLRLVEEERAKEIAEAEAKALAAERAMAKEIANKKRDAEEKAKLEAEAAAEKERLKLEAQAIAEAKALELEKAEAEAEMKRAAKEEEMQLAEDKARAEAKAVAEEQERLRLEAEAKALELENAKAAADKAAEAERLRLEEANKLKEQEAAKAAQNNIDGPTASDALGQSLSEIAEQAEDSKTEQQELLQRLSEAVENKNQDLKDLKNENDLSEQGVVLEPKPFKSVTAENNAIEALKNDLNKSISERNQEIEELQKVYDERIRIKTLENDEVSLFYKKKIERLKAEQAAAIRTKNELSTSLADIKVATEIERKRRIKRAVYDSEADRYEQDRTKLRIIKQTTPLSNKPLTEADFDFGEAQSDNIQILKNVQNVENGYYLIVAVHDNTDKRDEFIKKVVASGRTDVDFFYDVNTSKYYIYYQKTDSVDQANTTLKSKGDRPYNSKMSIVKIEN